MKTGGMAILLFVAAFVITTAALIFLNTQYMNLFKFDFRPVSHAAQAVSDSTGTAEADSSAVQSDSSKAVDSLKAIAGNLNASADSLAAGKVAENTKPAENAKPAEVKEVKKAPEQNSTVQNSSPAPVQSANQNIVTDLGSASIKKMDAQTFEKWKKNTAGILESMDSYKASQILRMYADNIGNELLYAMKKKKAAEILSRFDAKKDSIIIRKLTRIQ